MTNNIKSFIAISSDFETLQDSLKEEFSEARIISFIKDDFLTEDAKAVIKEAYIAESSLKIILLAAKRINIYAQNALLKVLEEPPNNICFILAIPNKSALLPTIRSRLCVKIYESKKEPISTGLDFKNLSLNDVYIFLKDKKYLSKDESMELIETITKEAIKQGINFTHEELDLFANLLKLASLNSRAGNLLTTQLLTILTKVS